MQLSTKSIKGMTDAELDALVAHFQAVRAAAVSGARKSIERRAAAKKGGAKPKASRVDVEGFLQNLPEEMREKARMMLMKGDK